MQEAKMQSQVWSGGQGLVIAGTQVGHLAHLAGRLPLEGSGAEGNN